MCIHRNVVTPGEATFLSDEFLSPTYTLLWIEVVLLNKTMLVANSDFFRLWLLFFDPNVECPKVSEENWMSREYRLFQDLGTPGGCLDEDRLKRWRKGVIRCVGWISALLGGVGFVLVSEGCDTEQTFVEIEDVIKRSFSWSPPHLPEISFSVGSTLCLSSHSFIVLTCGECTWTGSGGGGEGAGVGPGGFGTYSIADCRKRVLLSHLFDFVFREFRVPRF